MTAPRFFFSLAIVVLPWVWFLLESAIPSPGAAAEIQFFRAAGISSLFAVVLGLYATEPYRKSRPMLALTLAGILLGVALLPIPAAKFAMALG
jgi:hypothetical protein